MISFSSIVKYERVLLSVEKGFISSFISLELIRHFMPFCSRRDCDLLIDFSLQTTKVYLRGNPSSCFIAQIKKFDFESFSSPPWDKNLNEKRKLSSCGIKHLWLLSGRPKPLSFFLIGKVSFWNLIYFNTADASSLLLYHVSSTPFHFTSLNAN